MEEYVNEALAVGYIHPSTSTSGFFLFQAFINKNHPLITHYVTTYIDDILIYSANLNDHIYHLCTVLSWFL